MKMKRPPRLAGILAIFSRHRNSRKTLSETPTSFCFEIARMVCRFVLPRQDEASKEILILYASQPSEAYAML